LQNCFFQKRPIATIFNKIIKIKLNETFFAFLYFLFHYIRFETNKLVRNSKTILFLSLGLCGLLGIQHAFGQSTKSSLDKELDSVKYSVTHKLAALKKAQIQLLQKQVSNYLPDSALSKKKIIDSLEQLLTSPINDLVQKLSSLASLPDFKVGAIEKPNALFGLESGHIVYQYNYRSGFDTGYLTQALGQQFIQASVSTTLFDRLPVNINYSGRLSNSPYFKDFHDITVDFDAYRYQEMVTQQMRSQLNSSLAMFNDLDFAHLLDNQFQDLLKNRTVSLSSDTWQQYITSKENLYYLDEKSADPQVRDSIRNASQAFINQYEDVIKQLDSIDHAYNQVIKDYKNYIQLKKDALNQSMNGMQNGFYATTKKANSSLDSMQNRFAANPLKKLALGRTTPNISDLSLKNININGVHFVLAKGNYFMQMAAGVVDFRINDYLFTNANRATQYMIASSIGYGQINRSHLMLTGFWGDKLLFSGSTKESTTKDFGLSLLGKYQINANHTVSIEIAQSQSANPLAGLDTKNAFFDPAARAYTFRLHSSLPKSNFSVEGYYTHQGKLFQNFASYRLNTIGEAWMFKFEKYFFERTLKLVGAVKKNELTNPYIQQLYSNETIFSTFTATFRKRKWPSVTIGFSPISQLNVIGNAIYENRVNSFLVNSSHQYRLGVGAFTTSLFYNQLSNNALDSFGLPSVNSILHFIQTVEGRKVMLHCGVQINAFSKGHLTKLEGGFGYKLSPHLQCKAALAIHQLNGDKPNVGHSLSLLLHLTQLGDLQLTAEKTYLPYLQYSLKEIQQVNISFIKYFNFK
jgi:hypothetical protein